MNLLSFVKHKLVMKLDFSLTTLTCTFFLYDPRCQELGLVFRNSFNGMRQFQPFPLKHLRLSYKVFFYCMYIYPIPVLHTRNNPRTVDKWNFQQRAKGNV